MRKLALYFVLLCSFAAIAYAQPRIVDKTEKKPAAAIAPVSFKAKYEGGMFGFNKKEEGTLKFDDANLRIVFFNKENKEIFGIPYDSLIVIYPNNQSVQNTAGKVVQNVPIIGAGALGQIMKSKLRYLVLNFDDQDMDAKGTANFKLETSELLQSVVQTLGEKAEMQQRGDAYYRPKRKVKKEDDEQ